MAHRFARDGITSIGAVAGDPFGMDDVGSTSTGRRRVASYAELERSVLAGRHGPKPGHATLGVDQVSARLMRRLGIDAHAYAMVSASSPDRRPLKVVDDQEEGEVTVVQGGPSGQPRHPPGHQPLEITCWDDMLSWDGTWLKVRPLPETAARAMAGGLLRDFVSHPDLDDLELRIVAAEPTEILTGIELSGVAVLKGDGLLRDVRHGGRGWPWP